MAIKTNSDSAFKGIVQRNCKCNPIGVYSYKNGCVIYAYKRVIVLKQPDSNIVVYTGKDMQMAFKDVEGYIDGNQVVFNIDDDCRMIMINKGV